MSSSPSTMSDYSVWSFHIPAFRASAPPQAESPAPMHSGVGGVDEMGGHGSTASSATAALPIFDARSLVVKREPAPAPLLGDAAGFGAEVHGSTVLRRSSSAFGFVDVGDSGHQQPLPPSAICHQFSATMVPSPRLWTTEPMPAAADEYDVSTGPRMDSCGGGSLSGSDAGGRPLTSAVSSEDRSPTSPTVRVQPFNSVHPTTASTTSNIFIGKSSTRSDHSSLVHRGVVRGGKGWISPVRCVAFCKH